MTQIIYSSEKITSAGGRKVKNPNHFVGPVDGVDKVYLNGDFPAIRKAYEGAGVDVANFADMRSPPKSRAKPAETEKRPAAHEPTTE